jgi:hypothetical protein
MEPAMRVWIACQTFVLIPIPLRTKRKGTGEMRAFPQNLISSTIPENRIRENPIPENSTRE